METTKLTEEYVRKPLIVEAVQVTAENFETMARWCAGEIRNLNETPITADTELDPSAQYIRVRVHNPKHPNQTKAKVGDWLLYTTVGGYKVYTDKAFRANFDKVEEPKDFSDEDPNGAFLPED